ncbi:sensor histidine kinase [Chitinophagaceae bacterium MMS25-I14]
MKSVQKIFSVHTVRVILNLLAWAFMLDTIYGNYKNDVAGHVPDGFWMHVVLMHLLYCCLIYLNTIVFIPQILLRKKYLLYVLVLLLHICCMSLVIGNYSEWLIHHFPGLHKYDFIAFSIADRSKIPGGFEYYSNVAMDIFAVLLFFSLGYFMQRFFRERKRMAELEKKQLESELQLLRSQINPHFLFNVLNSIYSLSLKKSDDTPKVVLKLSDMLRYMLYESQADMVPLDKEIDMLRNYIDIEQVRLVRKDSVQFSVEGSAKHWYIASSVLLPFIENAIKHGIDSNATNAVMQVMIRIAGDTLSFHCVNNYKLQPNRVKINNAGGIGLENVRKRLQLIYGKNHDLEIKDDGSRYDVSLQLKLTNHAMPDNR